MEQKRIPIKGINRSYDDGIADDGCCMELINARIRNGSVEPIGAPVEIKELSAATSKVFFHQQVSRMLVISSSGTINTYHSTTYEYAQQLSSGLSGTKHIEFLGNMAIFFTDNATKYCIFKENAYQYLGERPSVPLLGAQPYGTSFGVCPDTNFLICDREQGFSNDEFYSSFIYAQSGMYDNCIDTANKQGYFFGSLFAVAALRMYDGSYCAFSPISFIEADNAVEYKYGFRSTTNTSSRSVTLDRISPISCTNKTTKTGTFYDICEAVVYAMRPNVTIAAPEDNLRSWKDIITAIDVFVCPVSFCVKEQRKSKGSTEYDSYVNYRGDKSKSKQRDIIANATMFYRYAEFDLDCKLQWILEDVSTDNLALQDSISLSNVTYPVAPTSTYVYNNRLHVAGYKEYFPCKNLMNLRDNIYNKEYGDDREVHFYFYIRTDEANAVVHDKELQHSYSTIAPYIMYYDNRAYKVLVAWRYPSESTWYGKEFELTKSRTLNMAYYIHYDTYADGRYGSSTFSEIATSIDLTTFPKITTLPTEKDTFIIKKNILKVSSLYNALSFPNAQSYQVSSANIVGFCSNTQALSQGQFGQHPLYVFCKDGIYAMSVDTSGSIVYTSQTPVSRDVCTNASTIYGIDSAVLFATERGLMAITGSTVTLLSADLDGYLPSCIDSSPLLPKIAAIASMDDKLSKTEFHNYLDGYLAISIAYIYATREIIISNRLYTYSYIYNLDSSTWSKVDYVIQQTTNHYPETYAILRHADGTLHLKDLHNPYRTVSKTLIMTKPVKMGTNSHKRVLQSALRALVHPAQSDLYFRGEPVMFRDEQVDIFSNIGLYVLGSNDAEHFELLHGKESIKDVRDLVTKMNKTRAYKYFMIALAGGVRTDIAINYMEFLIDDAYTNRLR